MLLIETHESKDITDAGCSQTGAHIVGSSKFWIESDCLVQVAHSGPKKSKNTTIVVELGVGRIMTDGLAEIPMRLAVEAPGEPYLAAVAVSICVAGIEPNSFVEV